MRYPEKGDRVLAWFDGEWVIAIFKDDKSRYCWDFDTWGVPREDVQVWTELPPAP